MTIVPPDGPTPCDYAVVGEAPANEEVRQGLGFVGPSGSLLWPLMRRLAMLDRAQCYVTNLCKHPLDNDVSGDLKLSEDEFAACQRELWAELDRVRPRRILAVGALAAKALLGDRYVGMDVCNGIGFAQCPPGKPHMGGWPGPIVVPTWHPAAALRPGGEDRLAYTGAAIAAFNPAREVKLCPSVPPVVPPTDVYGGRRVLLPILGIDTEGTPEDPICMTAASSTQRWYVARDHVPLFFATLDSGIKLRFHNVLWDWPVLWAMGAPRDLHTRWRWRDTMEMAYLRQTEPRGLKELAYRHLGLRMRSWEDVVMPHYHAMLRAAAGGRVAAGTTHVTHSPKGRLLKKPKTVLANDVKPLKRALGNPELLAKRMPGMPPPSLWWVPEAERIEYATLDAWATVMLEEHLR